MGYLPQQYLGLPVLTYNMEDQSIILATLGLMGTTVAALIWVVKKQFTMQDNTMREQAVTISNNNKAYERLAAVIERLEKSINDRDTEQLEILRKISEKQDVIYDTITTTNMTVQTMFVEKEVKKD